MDTLIDDMDMVPEHLLNSSDMKHKSQMFVSNSSQSDCDIDSSRSSQSYHEKEEIGTYSESDV